MANERLSHGLSSVHLENKRTYKFGLKTEEDIRKFEELNGIKVTPDYANLNDQSLDQMDMMGKMSYTSWNVKDLQSQSEQQSIMMGSARQVANPGATNFDFQTKKQLLEIS